MEAVKAFEQVSDMIKTVFNKINLAIVSLQEDMDG